jgi:putative phosphoribosyl transferase
MWRRDVMFRDRADAGRQLAAALVRFKVEDCIVYALPRGGVPVAYEVAKALAAPLDIVLVRKIAAPFQPELALGAIVDGPDPEIVLNEDIVAHLQPSEELLRQSAERELKEIRRRRQIYLCGHAPLAARGRVVIVVDDGLATGATARAALRALRRQEPKRIILAVPVGPRDVVEEMRAEVDEVICLSEPEDFSAVGGYYRDFPQIADAEVVALLGTCREMLAAKGDS